MPRITRSSSKHQSMIKSPNPPHTELPPPPASTEPDLEPLNANYLYIHDLDEKYSPIVVKQYPKVKHKEDGEWPQFRSVASGECPFPNKLQSMARNSETGHGEQSPHHPSSGHEKESEVKEDLETLTQLLDKQIEACQAEEAARWEGIKREQSVRAAKSSQLKRKQRGPKTVKAPNPSLVHEIENYSQNAASSLGCDQTSGHLDLEPATLEKGTGSASEASEELELSPTKGKRDQTQTVQNVAVKSLVAQPQKTVASLPGIRSAEEGQTVLISGSPQRTEMETVSPPEEPRDTLSTATAEADASWQSFHKHNGASNHNIDVSPMSHSVFGTQSETLALNTDLPPKEVSFTLQRQDLVSSSISNGSMPVIQTIVINTPVTKPNAGSTQQPSANISHQDIGPQTLAETQKLRRIEVAEYRERMRREKMLARIERQTRKERDIVSEAIEAVIAETSNHNPNIDTHVLDEKPASKTNAFTMMMSQSSKLGKHARYPTAAPMRFDNYITAFERALNQSARSYLSDEEYSKILGTQIYSSVLREIVEHCPPYAHIDTKINALRAISEIASGVAYAPQSEISDKIRSGHVPSQLIGYLHMIVDNLSNPESKLVLKDNYFMNTITQLRQDHALEYQDDIWNGLDDVLRVLGDSGPVDFRKVYKKIAEKMEDFRDPRALSSVVKSIRRGIVDGINHSSCFETKYNALNVLADIGMNLVQGWCDHPLRTSDCTLLTSTICDALLKISRILTLVEAGRIVEEFRMDEDIPDASCAHRFDHEMVIKSCWYKSHSEVSWTERWAIFRVASKKTKKKSARYCDNGVLAKLLHIRWKRDDLEMDSMWKNSQQTFEEALAIFVDTFTPVAPEEYLQELNQKFDREICIGEDVLRPSVDCVIDQISKRSTQRAKFESRMNSLKILLKIGLRLVEFVDPTKPFWQTRIFKDQVTEDNLVEAIRAVCYTLVKEDRAVVLGDAQILQDFEALNSRRLQMTDVMDGLDAVADLLAGTDMSGGTSWKRKANAVIDLTDSEVPLKRRGNPGSGKGITIDLTVD